MRAAPTRLDERDADFLVGQLQVPVMIRVAAEPGVGAVGCIGADAAGRALVEAGSDD